MNKLTKIGVSALCGSLAAVAAQAGALTVSGGATVTHTSNTGDVTGNPLGMTSGVTFTGAGELDNGNAVGYSIAMDDGLAALSSAQITLDMAGLGKISFDQGGGTGLDRLDDEMPSAWNVPQSAGLGSGIQIATGAGNGTDIELAVSSDILPDGMSAYLSWNPRVAGGTNGDKTASGDTGKGSGYDVVLRSTGIADGLDLFAGYSVIEQPAGTSFQGDNTAHVIGAKYAIGSVTVGYQRMRDNKQASTATGTRYYENDHYGIAFNISDDLSISYGETKSTRAQQGTTSNEAKASSIQLSYTMGGATIAIAENSVDNASYISTTTQDKDGTTIALTLAF